MSQGGELADLSPPPQYEELRQTVSCEHVDVCLHCSSMQINQEEKLSWHLIPRPRKRSKPRNESGLIGARNADTVISTDSICICKINVATHLLEVKIATVTHAARTEQTEEWIEQC